MMMKEDIVKQIIKDVGGSENINNAWHCISFWDWRYSEDKTQIYEYYEDLNEISCVIDISYLTKVD